MMIIILLLAYFIPAVIADRRKHPNRMAIGALNLFLGWTFLGWVAAFVWSLTSATARQERIVEVRYVERAPERQSMTIEHAPSERDAIAARMAGYQPVQNLD